MPSIPSKTDHVYDPLDFEALDDPYPLYKWLRDERPVYQNRSRGIWALTRYEDVQSAARDWRTFSSTPGVDLDDGSHAVFGQGDFANIDPPRHDLLRDVVRRHFSPAAIKELEPYMEKIANSLIDGFPDGGEVDLARGFGWQMPVQVIAHVLGLPPDDQPRLLDLSRMITRRVSGSSRVPDVAREAAQEMVGYFRRMMSDSRAANPLMATMFEAAESSRIKRGEVLGLSMMIFVAGMETTASLISNALMLLDRHPEKQRDLRDHPESIEAAIEEFLRFDSPVQELARTATSDVELHGSVIPKGGRVVLVYASANRDERRFPRPDDLDFGRPPARHLAFGDGIHFCLGAPLARPEARIALTCFLQRIGEYSVIGPVRRLPTYTSRGFESIVARIGQVGSVAVPLS